MIPPGSIKSWKDLLDPKWKGKIISSDPRGGGPGQATARYLLVKFGDGTQQLGPTIQSTLGSTSGLTCFALATTLNGAITGYTDFECGLPFFATLNP